MRALLLALVFLLVPSGLFASTLEANRNSLVVSEPPAGNAYFFGADLTVAAPVSGDLTASGASVVVSAPVSGDALVAGGSVDIRKTIAGDLRILGGRIMVDDAVAGDLVAAGGSVTIHSSPSFVWIAGGAVTMDKGASGPVTIYGSTVLLAGTYAGDVHVTASDRLSLAPNTVIRGKLKYDAPQQADIPASATAAGGVEYTGKSFLPTVQEARTFALAGAGIFFLVRILASIIAVGVIGGVFPSFAQMVADATLSRSSSRFALLALLGFGLMAATPILIVLLLATFAGAGLAFILMAAYALFLMLSFIYAAVIAGAALARGVAKRPLFLWRDGVFGMLALSLIALIPVIGWIALLVIIAAAAGTLASLFYHAAFAREDALPIE